MDRRFSTIDSPLVGSLRATSAILLGSFLGAVVVAVALMTAYKDDTARKFWDAGTSAGVAGFLAGASASALKRKGL